MTSVRYPFLHAGFSLIHRPWNPSLMAHPTEHFLLRRALLCHHHYYVITFNCMAFLSWMSILIKHAVHPAIQPHVLRSQADNQTQLSQCICIQIGRWYTLVQELTRKLSCWHFCFPAFRLPFALVPRNKMITRLGTDYVMLTNSTHGV